MRIDLQKIRQRQKVGTTPHEEFTSIKQTVVISKSDSVYLEKFPCPIAPTFEAIDPIRLVRDAFPGSIVKSDEDVRLPRLVTLQCLRNGKATTVNPEVCKWHIETGSGICMEHCLCEWSLNRLDALRQQTGRKSATQTQGKQEDTHG